MQYIGSLEAAEKHISAKIFKENLHTSVKILQICMDLQDSVHLQDSDLHRFAKIENLGMTPKRQLNTLKLNRQSRNLEGEILTIHCKTIS